MAIGWDIWVLLEYIGAVSGVVRTYIDFIIILLFPTSLFILYFSCLLFLCNIANVAQRTFEMVQKLGSRGHGDIIILTRTYVDYASRDFHMRGTE